MLLVDFDARVFLGWEHLLGLLLLGRELADSNDCVSLLNLLGLIIGYSLLLLPLLLLLMVLFWRIIITGGSKGFGWIIIVVLYNAIALSGAFDYICP